MIYLLEDDESIRKLVVYTLESQGYEAEGFSCPSLFWSAMKKNTPSLLLLDIMLPEEDGLQVLKKLRSNSATKKLPVILLTAKNSEYDLVVGLDSGADDYIAKPFGMMELMARVKALLRRTEEQKQIVKYQLEGLYVCPEEHAATIDGEDIPLTYKEFEMLCVLLENKGKVLTRDMLMDKVWGSDFDRENRTVDVHIRTLRSKLREYGNLIETVRGVGYKIGGSHGG